MLAALPYRTFPTIPLGPLDIHTFGLFVTTGIAVGVALAARRARAAGVPSDQVVTIGVRMVLAGIAGARLTWVATHWNQIDSPLDALAVWRGGLQFSGGFIAAMAVGVPSLRPWPAAIRRQLLDRFAIGLAVGLAFGRIGCYAVGEHLGRPTGFVLGTRYQGGETREGPLVVGEVIHNTSLYEFVHLVVLARILAWLTRRASRAQPGTTVGVFCLWYGGARFTTDTLRAHDDRVMSLTGAQWMCLLLLVVGAWILTSRHRREVIPRAADGSAIRAAADET